MGNRCGRRVALAGWREPWWSEGAVAVPAYEHCLVPMLIIRPRRVPLPLRLYPFTHFRNTHFRNWSNGSGTR